jgi:fucose 4-O-acetylase-like acetyltransferase
VPQLPGGKVSDLAAWSGSSDDRVRIAWADTARGFAIILVVYEHVVRGLVTSGVMTWTPATRFVDTWIYTFHMPVFFFVSGLFVSGSAKRNWRTFTADKLRTIAYPYFVWSIITILIKVPLGDYPNHPSRLSDLARIPYDPIDQFWFLYVLFILLIVASGLLKLRASPWLILFLSMLFYFAPVPLHWSVLIETRMFAIYFAAGLLAGWGRDLQRLLPARELWLATILVVGLFISSLSALVDLPYSYALQPLLAMAGIVAVLAGSVLFVRRGIEAPIRFLGRHSLEIYLVHTIALAGVRIALQHVAHVSAPMVHLVLGTLAGIYVPIALVLILNWVGFRCAFVIPRPTPNLAPSVRTGEAANGSAGEMSAD